ALPPDMHVFAAQRGKQALALGIRERAADAPHQASHGGGGHRPIGVTTDVLQQIAVETARAFPRRLPDPRGEIIEEELELMAQHEQLRHPPLDLEKTLLRDTHHRASRAAAAIAAG